MRIARPVLIAYGLYLGVMWAAQERLVFIGAHLPTAAVADPLAEHVWLTMPDGVRVEAWYRPGVSRSAASPGPAVIFFHGNLHRCVDKWDRAAPYAEAGFSVLMPEYRGYAASEGRPNEPVLIADSLRFHDWLAARPEVDRSRIVLHGQSLGGGVACAVAEQRPPAALLLEATFTSVADVGNRLLLPSLLCRHPFRSDLRVASVRCPILILHGTRDILIPVSHARRMHALAPRSRLIEIDAGHRGFPFLWRDIRQFLADSGLCDPPAQ